MTWQNTLCGEVLMGWKEYGWRLFSTKKASLDEAMMHLIADLMDKMINGNTWQLQSSL